MIGVDQSRLVGELTLAGRDNSGTLSMEFDGNIFSFNIFKAMRYPNEVHTICSIVVTNSLAQ